MSMLEPPPSPVDSLVVVRVLLAATKGAKAADVRKDLDPILGRRWPGAELASVVDRTLIKLAAAGLVVRSEGKTKKAAATFATTDAGRAAALGALGVKELPAKPKPTWASVKKSLLTATALGLPGTAAVAKDDVLRAVLLDRGAELGLGGTPTLKQAKDAWTRKLLGMGPKEKVTLETVQAALFRRALSKAPLTPLPSKAALDRLIAERLGAAGRPLKDLRDEAIRRWAVGEAEEIEPEATAAEPAPPMELAEFARRVRDAARRCGSGRYGGDKVFVAHVWRALDDPAIRNGGIDGFKGRLAEANNARLLSLSRADLVQAMDPEDVRISEVPYMNTCFHFVRDDLDGEAAS